MEIAKITAKDSLRNYFSENVGKVIDRNTLKKAFPNINPRTIDRMPDHMVAEGFLEKAGKAYRLKQEE